MRKMTSLFSGAAAGALLAFAAAGAQAQETTTTWSGAPRFQNESLTFKVRGRVFIDAVAQNVEGGRVGSGVGIGELESFNTRIRTARLGVEGTWNTNWAYKAEVSLASGGGSNAQWEDLLLEYKPDDFSSIMIGNFKTLGLENMTSSRFTTFMERGPYADALDFGRVLNVAYRRNGQNWTATIAAQGDSLNDADVSGDEMVGLNGRVTYAPIDSENNQVHLGAWARYRDAGEDGALNYQVRSNTNYSGQAPSGGATLSGGRYIGTGGIGQTDTTVGLEAAWIRKSLSLQAEAANIGVERRTGGPDGDVRAAYAFLSWFPTGETRRYEAARGEFNRVRILNPVSVGGRGAVELAARYDYVDVQDLRGTPVPNTAAVLPQAGKYTGYTLGANWYPFPYVRFMANYTLGKNDAPVSAFDADVNTFQMRAQFDF